jgi:alpha-galactosidase
MGSRIVLVGSGSAAFSFNSLVDAVNAPALKGANIVLHEEDEAWLRTLVDVSERMNEEMGSDLEIQGIIDRVEALRGADFIILNVSKDRIRRWRMDWEIPFKHGIKQVIGENDGPGGLFHTLRMVPQVLEICRDNSI